MLVSEELELVLQVGLDISWDQLQQHDFGEQDAGDDQPLGSIRKIA